jgi:hypothetical protein
VAAALATGNLESEMVPKRNFDTPDKWMEVELSYCVRVNNSRTAVDSAFASEVPCDNFTRFAASPAIATRWPCGADVPF